MTRTDLLSRFRRKGMRPREDYLFPFQTLRRELNRLFEDFAETNELLPFEKAQESLPGYFPQVDVKDTGEAIVVTAELPGVDEKDVSVEFSNEMLTFKGEKKAEKEEKEKDYYRMERSYGSFIRSIPMPCDVDGNKVIAKFKKGVLSVMLPKTEKAKSETKQVKISTD